LIFFIENNYTRKNICLKDDGLQNKLGVQKNLLSEIQTTD
jgi:hypothetical protein